MTIVCEPIDASAGSPAYTAQQARNARSGMWANGTARLLGAQSGPVAGHAPVITASSTVWSVGLGSFVVDPAFTSTQSAYEVAVTVAETGSVTAAHATLNRYDMLTLIVNDSSVDASGSRNGQVVYTVGTGTSLAASPVVQTTPARSVKLADIFVPLSGGGSPTVTANQQFAVSSGGLLPVVSSTKRDALITAPYDGFPVYRQDKNTIEVFNGVGWDTYLPASATQQIQSGTATLTTNGAGNGTVTYPTAFTSGTGTGSIPVPVVTAASGGGAFAYIRLGTLSLGSFTFTAINTSGTAMLTSSVTLAWIAAGTF